MTLVDRIDDFGKPAWIVLTVLGFMVFWPIGLLMLGFTIGSGRMGCRHGYERWQRRMDRTQQRMNEQFGRAQETVQRHAQRWYGGAGGPYGGESSGNRAFDEYREETLRRLEDEQREFKDFLDRLRHAKDKAEFDQFMAERRPRPPNPSPEPPAAI